ncbi:MAG: menaquinone biosynthesis protein [Pirellula sp.]
MISMQPIANRKQSPYQNPLDVTVRVGAVSYLNSKPLVHGLAHTMGPQGRLSLAVPSKLATELAAGAIDIGLVPVVDYFRHPEFRIVSNAVIACCGPVWSVRLLFRVPPEQVKTIAMDEGSHTSVALTKVLYQERFGFVPTSIRLPMDSDPREVDADAVLVIGDRSMHPTEFRPHFASDWDLGQSWFEDTGLPFVFAMWVARDSRFATVKYSEMLADARDAGIRNIAQIAERDASMYRLSARECEDYLTNYIRFYLGEQEQAGLAEFRRRCTLLNLVPPQSLE